MVFASKLLEGKKGIIMGVANEWSIAWGVAQALDAAGAEIAFTCINERFAEKTNALLQRLTGNHTVHLCDVSKEGDIEKAFESIHKAIDKIDFLVHSIAFADKEYLKDEYSKVTRAAFLQALDISCFSFTESAKFAARMMNDGGSMIAMSFGGGKFVPNYNVMGVAKAALEASAVYLANDFGERGIRVNCISPGPIKTLSAMGVGGLEMLAYATSKVAPIRELVDIEDVGGCALYLLSSLSKKVTGQTIYVDSGVSCSSLYASGRLLK